MSLSDATQAVERMIRSVRAIRAERWLHEWPDGHAERPQAMPEFVRLYLAESNTPKPERT